MTWSMCSTGSSHRLSWWSTQPIGSGTQDLRSAGSALRRCRRCPAPDDDDPYGSTDGSARYRLEGTIAEIRHDDLLFSSAEAAWLLGLHASRCLRKPSGTWSIGPECLRVGKGGQDGAQSSVGSLWRRPHDTHATRCPGSSAHWVRTALSPCPGGRPERRPVCQMTSGRGSVPPDEPVDRALQGRSPPGGALPPGCGGRVWSRKRDLRRFRLRRAPHGERMPE